MSELDPSACAVAVPMTPCDQCPLRPKPVFRTASVDEVAFIQSLKVGEQSVRARATILREGERAERMFTLLSGWAFRFKTLPDGRRQILNFLLPGDLVGLQAKLFAEASHGVEALTDATLCMFSRDRVWDIFREQPQLAFDLTWLGAQEERLVDDALLSTGRRTAVESMAALIAGLYRRAQALDLVVDGVLAFPVPQGHLADALGLSPVHTNRTLQWLRSRALFELSGGVLRAVKLPELQRVARSAGGPVEERPLI